MAIDDSLTYFQKVALKGEIGFALSTSAHNTEIKYRTYLILKEVEDKYKPFIIDCIKEGVTFDESIIDQIYLETVSNTIPIWLWIEEVIADIKLHLFVADSGMAMAGGVRLGIDRLTERKNLIESAFIMFVREAIILSPDAAEELMNAVLDDNELEFLYNACFCLRSLCLEAKELLGKDRTVPEEIMSHLFDIKKVMSFTTETKALNALNREQKKRSQYTQVAKAPLPTGDENNNNEIKGEITIQGGFSIDNTITHEELSNYISEKIAELFEGNAPKKSPTPSSNTVYVVKKVFTDSGISTNIRVCKTEEEAINFINKIIKAYPDLTNTCEFQVHTERVHGKNQKGSEEA